MRSCAHKVHTTIGGRKEGHTEGRKAENYVPPAFLRKKKRWAISKLILNV